MVINEGDKPYTSDNVVDFGGSPNITMYQGKWMRWFVRLDEIGIASVFGQLTYFALKFYGTFI